MSWFNCSSFHFLSAFVWKPCYDPQEIEEVKSELKTAENDMELRQNEQGTSRIDSRMQENAWKMQIPWKDMESRLQVLSWIVESI